MPHTAHNHPAMRPGHFFNSRFENDGGAWDEWEFKTDYMDQNEFTRTATFAVGVPGGATGLAGICLEGGDVGDLTEAEFRAHARMGSWCCGRTPASTEWSNDFIGEGATVNFQMAIGTVKMEDYTVINDQSVDIRFKLGNNGPYRTVRFDYSELSRDQYVFDPVNQIYIIPGAIKIGLGYVHKSNGELTQTEKDAIVAYVDGLKPWI